MKDIIQQIENIQKYCSMIVQNGVKRVDIFMDDVDLDTLGKLAEYYDVTVRDDGILPFMVIEDESCEIYINLKTK